MVIGSNTTETHPVIGAMIKQRVREGAKLIVCDPRKIELHSFAEAAIHQRCGSDTALINAMMNVMIEEGLTDSTFIKERTEGYESLRAVTARYTPEYAEKITAVLAGEIRRMARIYGKARNAAIFYTMGITQHTTGTDNVKALCSLAMLGGNLGRPGTGVNPLRGQGNVQGACDMGCLPATLPGYLKVTEPEAAEKVKKLWGCSLPAKPGLTVVPMIEAAARGELTALFIMGESPLVTDADSHHTQKALEKLDFLVVQDIFLTETAQLADVVLPAACWPEKEGTCTNTTRSVQLLRKASKAPGEAREDWRTFAELAKRFGLNWHFENAEAVFEEIRGFTPSYAGISWKRLEAGPLCWPCPDEAHPGTPVLHKERFARKNGLAKFLPVEWQQPYEWPDEEYPFIATTGRMLYHYHSGSMTRRGVLGRKASALYIEIAPQDAARLGITEECEVTVESRRGAIKGKAKVTEKVPAGMLFIPFHFAEAAANMLTAAVCDNTSGTPAFKINAVKLKRS